MVPLVLPDISTANTRGSLRKLVNVFPTSLAPSSESDDELDRLSRGDIDNAEWYRSCLLRRPGQVSLHSTLRHDKTYGIASHADPFWKTSFAGGHHLSRSLLASWKDSVAMTYLPIMSAASIQILFYWKMRL